MNDEEKAIQEWFRDNQFRVQLEIGKVNVSLDPDRPDNRPNHQEKYARVDRLSPGTEPQFFRRYKMDENDTTLDSLKRIKKLLEADMSTAQQTRNALSIHVLPKLQRCACPVCQSVDWRVSESIFEMREFFGGAMLLGGGQVLPVILATCHFCGHILPFNAIHVGVVKEPEEIKQ